VHRHYSAVVGLLLSFPILSSAGDMGRFSWNDEMARVAAEETAAPVFRGDRQLAYEVYFGANKALLLYEFRDGKLAAGGYDFEISPKQNLMETFAALLAKLQENYGIPSKNVETWVNTQYRNQPKNYDVAVQIGDLTCTATWDTGNTQILMTMSGQPEGVNVSVTFVSKAFAGRITRDSISDRRPVVGGRNRPDQNAIRANSRRIGLTMPTAR
jgi:hypothetical protein